MPKIDILNHRFGLLTVERDTGNKNKSRSTLWECRCDCGKQVIRPVSELRRGNAWSCGCTVRSSHNSELRPSNLPKKGSPTHNSWRGAKERVRNIDLYRKRGMCQGLKGSFQLFFSILGERPPNTSLDRIHNDLGYYCGQCEECIEKSWPLNIRWATEEEQSLNKGQTTLIVIEGKEYSLSRAASYMKVCRHRLSEYLSTKGDIESFIRENDIDLN